MTFPRVFIAGCWNDRQKIKQAIEHFSQFCDVTHDWTTHEDESLFNNLSYLKCQAILDVDGIERADYLVVIMDVPNYAYMGTWTEIGIAIQSGIKI